MRSGLWMGTGVCALRQQHRGPDSTSYDPIISVPKAFGWFSDPVQDSQTVLKAGGR